MTARGKTLALKLRVKQGQNADYAQRIAIQVCMIEKDPETMEGKNV